MPLNRLLNRLSLAAPASIAIAFSALLYTPLSTAVILPEESVDTLYHRYEGGGMVIDGPSLLVRKNFKDKVSISANYYVDNVSSASIDVISSGASQYSEERTEYSVDATLVENKSLINIGYTNSEENDYSANSYRFDISHDFFGDMTTLSFGASMADDEISRNSDLTGNFQESLERRNYRFGIAQILTKNIILNLNFEGIIDEGYLNNPYRVYRYETPTGIATDTEVYPNTRNSEAYSLKLAWHLPWNDAIKWRSTYFQDSWEIQSLSNEVEYSRQINTHWLVDLRVRFYAQDQAEFYSDLFSESDLITQAYFARDKELSKFNNISLGLGVSYTFELETFFNESEVGIQVDWMQFDYDNFRENTPTNTSSLGAGNEPFYSFDAYALRMYGAFRF